MDHLQRDLRVTMRELVSSSTIEDFRFEAGGKHPKVGFRHNGRWYSMSYSMSPKTCNNPAIFKRKLRHIINNGAHARVQ